MNRNELLNSIHSLNEAELFYKSYQDAKKDTETFSNFLKNLDMQECLKKHFIIPELEQTLPPSMKAEYVLTEQDHGMKVQKHNCYSPVFYHFHTYYEIVYVYEGICYHYFNNKRTILKKGDVVIIPPNTTHAIFTQDTSIAFNLIISEETLENTFKNPTYYKSNYLSAFFMKSLSNYNENAILLYRTGNDDELDNIVLNMYIESVNKLDEFDAVLSGYYSIFFANLIRFYDSTAQLESANHSSDEMIDKIIIYIQQNHNTVTLDDLSREFFYSKEYLSKIIKEATGHNFTEIVTTHKMRHALSLLDSTSLSISEISYQVGYENVVNFNRVFKKIYNKTPTDYRKSKNEKENRK